MTTFTYNAPPPSETRFNLGSSSYWREIRRCSVCDHFVSLHEMNLNALYDGDYVNYTYGKDGIRRAFERLVALAPEKSDNTGRVERIIEFSRAYFPPSARDSVPCVLDVGSGLCVFLNKMKSNGWNCTAIDPDIRAVKHAREAVGIEAICGNLDTAENLGRFDLVTFNKVLEHVKDPVGLLAKALKHVKSEGFVYIEVPDGEAAAVAGPVREEFFIEHWHVFSAASLTLLAVRAGFFLRVLERLREPSGKYTLRAFLMPAL